MTDRYLTIVYRLPDGFDAAELTDHPHMSACAWSHALEEVRRLREIETAARNLVDQKGRHNTASAYQKLEEALK